MERDHKIEEENLISNSHETEVEETEKDQEGKEQEEQDEALSLCDLPIEEETRQSKKETQQENTSNQDEFDFSFSKESEMCSPDQIFFQGQILPFRHSITNITAENRRLSRSESIDTYHSNGFTSGGSSRSSSIRSHQSSTSSGGSSVTTPIYKPRVRNNFNSHPSPKPQMKFSRIKKQSMPNSNQKSTVWSLFRLGIVSTPEIVLEDLKNRSINNRNKDFQKSKSFDSTRFMSEKKKKQGIFEVNGTFFSSCKCSSNAVDIIPSRIGMIKRSGSGKDAFTHGERKGSKQHEEGKQSISSRRTFEWLKQISLDRTSSVRNDA